MKVVKVVLTYFKPYEWALLIVSLFASIFFYFYFHSTQYLYLLGSLVGFFAILFAAKGSPVGPFLMVVFSIFYGIVSYTYRYYGEMITYLGMTGLIALISFITWILHPSKERGVVETRKISWKEFAIINGISAVVTAAFYFILKALGTNNLIISTVSVFTSFTAVVFELRRSKYYSLFYMANDIVLIVMWSLAAQDNPEYFSLVICFAAFFINDVYGFISWTILERKQIEVKEED